jgi:hypothetical protein
VSIKSRSSVLWHHWQDPKALEKAVLSFGKSPRHECVLGEWKYICTHCLTSALDGGEWSASRPGCFTPTERAPGTHWIRDLGEPQRRSERGSEENNSQPPLRKSNPRTPFVQSAA